MYIYTIYTCIKTIYICWITWQFDGMKSQAVCKGHNQTRASCFGLNSSYLSWSANSMTQPAGIPYNTSSIGISKHAHFKTSFCLKYIVQNIKQCRKYYMEIDTISIKQDIYMYVGTIFAKVLSITKFKNRLLIDQFEYSTPFSNWSMLDNTFWNLLQIL